MARRAAGRQNQRSSYCIIEGGMEAVKQSNTEPKASGRRVISPEPGSSGGATRPKDPSAPGPTRRFMAHGGLSVPGLVLCRHYRYLPHGYVDRQNALERLSLKHWEAAMLLLIGCVMGLVLG